MSITRNAGATVFLPSENEWYKAAYYNPGHSSYYPVPDQQQPCPDGERPDGATEPANFSLTGRTTLTDVGAYSGTTSPYGAFDMGGNVCQWNEALITGSYRGLRGGSFLHGSGHMRPRYGYYFYPMNMSDNFGFRVASLVPEPSSVVLAGLGFVGFAAWAWRRRKRA